MPPVSGGACGDVPQCGCSAGLNCIPIDTTSGITGCVSTGSLGNYAGNCTGSGAGECPIGAACVDGVCSPLCRTAADCTGPYRACAAVQNSSGNNIPGFKVCTLTCDPVNPQLQDSTFSACGAGDGCLPDPNGASSCYAPTKSSGTQGASCSTSGSPDQSKCAVGFVCLQDLLSSSSCYKMCHVGSNADCTGSASGTTCGSFGSKEYAGPKEIGYCS
jgi:hypothetical protein